MKRLARLLDDRKSCLTSIPGREWLLPPRATIRPMGRVRSSSVIQKEVQDRGEMILAGGNQGRRKGRSLVGKQGLPSMASLAAAA